MVSSRPLRARTAERRSPGAPGVPSVAVRTRHPAAGRSGCHTTAAQAAPAATAVHGHAANWLCFARLSPGTPISRSAPPGNWLCFARLAPWERRSPDRHGGGNWLCFARSARAGNGGMMESWNAGGVLAAGNWLCFAQLTPRHLRPRPFLGARGQIGFVWRHCPRRRSCPPDRNWLCSARPVPANWLCHEEGVWRSLIRWPASIVAAASAGGPASIIDVSRIKYVD